MPFSVENRPLESIQGSEGVLEVAPARSGRSCSRKLISSVVSLNKRRVAKTLALVAVYLRTIT